jgi:oligosaccharide amylase
MVKEIVLGNGSILICIDKNGIIRDFYYPYVGQENHVQGKKHKIGVWADNRLSWIDEGEWKIKVRYKKDTLVSDIEAINESLGIKLVMADTVTPTYNIYLREIKVTNLRDEDRTIKLFLHQYFAIYGTDFGTTVFYHPGEKSIIFYKGERYFLVSGKGSNKTFDDFTTGKTGGPFKGSHYDAKNGELCKNPVEHGSVDSSVGFTLSINKKSQQKACYWIIAGKKYGEVVGINRVLLKENPSQLIQESGEHWEKWLNSKINTTKGLDKLDKNVFELFKKSLLILRTHVGKNGAIIASGDSDILKSLKYEDYSYVWPRDAAFVALALDRAGFHELTKKFFLFCNKIITNSGYMLHKYNSDFSAGSSWHSWIKYGRPRIPIQEDETALVLYALWNHYELTKDKKLLRKVYNDLIKNAADFMERYRYKKLPNESYDLWEEKFGIHTFTACTVAEALKCASKIMRVLKKKGYSRYLRAAKEIQKAIEKNLYDKKEGRFLKRIHMKEERVMKKYYDIDSSCGSGLVRFGIFDIENEKVKNTMKEIEEKLICTPLGGVARYEGDNFQKVECDSPGNPWIICTMWLAQYYIKKAKKVEDLKKVEDMLKWVVKHSSPTGMLSEQINPITGERISATPLMWSHAEFILTVIEYIKKLENVKN